MIPGLCAFCYHMQDVVSGHELRILLFRKHGRDNRFLKYPLRSVVQFQQPGEDVTISSRRGRSRTQF